MVRRPFAEAKFSGLLPLFCPTDRRWLELVRRWEPDLGRGGFISVSRLAPAASGVAARFSHDIENIGNRGPLLFAPAGMKRLQRANGRRNVPHAPLFRLR